MTRPEPDFSTFTTDDRTNGPNATLADALTRTLGDVPHRRPADPARATEADTALARQLVGLFSKLDARQRRCAPRPTRATAFRPSSARWSW